MDYICLIRNQTKGQRLPQRAKKFTQITATDKQFPNIENMHFMSIIFDKNGTTDKVRLNFPKEYKL